MPRVLSTCALFCMCLTLLSAQAPPAPGGRGAGPARDSRPQSVGTGVIRGRILTADTGTPVRRAQVRATSSTSRAARLTTTDADGRFEFRGLPAGRFDVTASKAGFVSMRYGQRRPFEAGTPIELANAQVLDRADFFLPRGAAITGRILDEFGEPVAGARIQALRYQVVQGTRRLMPIGMTTQTDDTGAFRLFGLMPGDYYVSAVLRAQPVDDPGDVTAYAPTYYPGTGSPTDAQRIPLSVAEEASISFALMPVRVATVSGRVIGSTGMPLAAGNVILVGADQAAGQAVAIGNAARVRPDGTFAIPNVPPGSYRAVATSELRRAGDAGIEMGTLPLSVNGDDLTDVAIVTSQGATLSGTVVVASDSTSKARPNGIQVTAQAVPADVAGGIGGRLGGGRVGNDGAFQLTNVFGPRLLRTNGLPQGWALQAVLAGGRDVTDTPIDFGTGDGSRSVQIIVTDRVTELSGTVTAGSSATRDYSVVVFPEDESKWAFPSRYVRSARPDQQGSFRIRALPPGERYLAIALDYVEDGEAADAVFLAQFKGRGTRFSIGSGESKALDLKLIER